MTTIRINLGKRSYSAVITSGGGERLAEMLRRRTASGVAIIADGAVRQPAERLALALRRQGLRVLQLMVPSGEASKTLKSAARLYDQLAGWHADRQTLIVAFGGGMVGDLAGFVAATFARGLPWFVVPTTLLAMLDSAIGGKVAVNLRRGKNLVGAFHQPSGIWADLDFLKTLPEREFRSGLAEAVKFAMARDAKLFHFLERNAQRLLAREPGPLRRCIARCCWLKARLVEQDEYDTLGLRSALNYGHTFAHAFETVSRKAPWLHGEAVAAGMACAAQLAWRLQLLSLEDARRQTRLLQSLQLPTQPGPWPISSILRVFRVDKKSAAGVPRFILPTGIGQILPPRPVPLAIVAQVIAELSGTRYTH